jgi:hypothetical protein
VWLCHKGIFIFAAAARGNGELPTDIFYQTFIITLLVGRLCLLLGGIKK